jgi:hypothetical protein
MVLPAATAPNETINTNRLQVVLDEMGRGQEVFEKEYADQAREGDGDGAEGVETR